LTLISFSREAGALGGFFLCYFLFVNLSSCVALYFGEKLKEFKYHKNLFPAVCLNKCRAATRKGYFVSQQK